MFGSRSVVSDRDKAKDLCGSGLDSGEGKSCQLEVNSVHLKFAWAQQVISQPLINLLTEPADLIILNVGSYYVFNPSYELSEVLDRVSAEAAELLDAINNSSNQRIIFRTATRLCDPDLGMRDLPTAAINAVLNGVNEKVVKILSASSKVCILKNI